MVKTILIFLISKRIVQALLMMFLKVQMFSKPKTNLNTLLQLLIIRAMATKIAINLKTEAKMPIEMLMQTIMNLKK